MHLPDLRKIGNAQTRANALRLMERYSFRPIRNNIQWLATVLIAFLVSWLPPIQHAVQAGELSTEGVWMLRIGIIAAGLWLTEAIPAFATAMMVMALQLLFVAGSGNAAQWSWSELLAVWGSPLIWLFFGGFLMAEAFSVVKLDRLAIEFILKRSGTSYVRVALALSAMTFVLSMFMSNTATITVVVALLAPLLKGEKHMISKRGLLLSLAVAANLGGMVTIVGTPPNAIAVASMAEAGVHVSFFKWILIAAPFSLLLFGGFFLYVKKFYFSKEQGAELDFTAQAPDAMDERGETKKGQKASDGEAGSLVQRIIVILILLGTVGMWLAQPFHGVHPTIIAFLAITALSMIGVLTSLSLRNVPWDILILMAGGLSLGKGISETGLAMYLTGLFPEWLPVMLIGLLFVYLAILMSNFMSNTAAANALLPLVLSATAASGGAQVVVAATFACSCAVLLPVSTPPNAICFATGCLKSKDYVRVGLGFILVVPPLAYLWTQLVMG